MAQRQQALTRVAKPQGRYRRLATVLADSFEDRQRTLLLEHYNAMKQTCAVRNRMSALGQKQTYALQQAMSVFRHVRLGGHKRIHATQQIRAHRSAWSSPHEQADNPVGHLRQKT